MVINKFRHPQVSMISRDGWSECVVKLFVLCCNDITITSLPMLDNDITYM